MICILLSIASNNRLIKHCYTTLLYSSTSTAVWLELSIENFILDQEPWTTLTGCVCRAF